jgi:hypothetical protein
MPDRPQSIPPPFVPPSAPAGWIEESAFRETFLLAIDDPEKRESVRRAGAAFFLMALEATYHNGTTEEDPSATRAELRAIAADLRYLQGYAAAAGYSAVSCSLEPAEHADALYAGGTAETLAAIAGSIETRLALPPAGSPERPYVDPLPDEDPEGGVR